MELKDIIEAGLSAQEKKLALAIEKFEGQLSEKGKIDSEVRNEVKELSEQYKSVAASLNEAARNPPSSPDRSSRNTFATLSTTNSAEASRASRERRHSA